MRNLFVYLVRILVLAIPATAYSFAIGLTFIFQFCTDCGHWMRLTCLRFMNRLDNLLPVWTPTQSHLAKKEAERNRRQLETNAHWGKLRRNTQQFKATSQFLDEQATRR